MYPGEHLCLGQWFRRCCLKTVFSISTFAGNFVKWSRATRAILVDAVMGNICMFFFPILTSGSGGDDTCGNLHSQLEHKVLKKDDELFMLSKIKLCYAMI